MTNSRTALEQGFAQEQAGHQQEAFESFRRAVDLDPTNGRAWRQIGNLLRRAGRLAEAGACFERAIENGDDAVLNTFFLSAIGVGPVVPAAPSGFASALYDQYAERFESHLTQALRYRAPARLADMVVGKDPALRFGSMLDLGCGTGLAGRAFRSLADDLSGVDISAQMVAQATATGLYDRLTATDLLTYLGETARHHDLVVACDVFIYFGDLTPVFRGVRRVLNPGGRFAFTVESSEATEGYDLLPTLRYAHSEPSVRSLAATCGFRVRGLEVDVLRTENDVPIEGLFVDLERFGN